MNVIYDEFIQAQPSDADAELATDRIYTMEEWAERYLPKKYRIHVSKYNFSVNDSFVILVVGINNTVEEFAEHEPCYQSFNIETLNRIFPQLKAAGMKYSKNVLAKLESHTHKMGD